MIFGAAGGAGSILLSGNLIVLAPGFGLSSGVGASLAWTTGLEDFNLRVNSDVTRGFAVDFCFFVDTVFRFDPVRRPRYLVGGISFTLGSAIWAAVPLVGGRVTNRRLTGILSGGSITSLPRLERDGPSKELAARPTPLSATTLKSTKT